MKKFQIAFSCPTNEETKIVNTEQVSFAFAASFAYVEAVMLREKTGCHWEVVAVYDLHFKIEEVHLS